MKPTRPSALFAALVLPLVLPAASALDQGIEEAARATYNYRTVLENQVKVQAREGVVTLTGTVPDREARVLAEDTVKGLPGVTRVRNDLIVQSPHPERTDGWIALKIRGRLLVKSKVSANTTSVIVRDGVATLGGTAETAAQKELTGRYAREIAGVKAVENHIVVDHAPSLEAVLGEQIDDASITSQVKVALLTHRSTRALQPQVTTKDGVIVITGEARSDAEKSLVTQLAQDVRGAQVVSNRMTVKS